MASAPRSGILTLFVLSTALAFGPHLPAPAGAAADLEDVLLVDLWNVDVPDAGAAPALYVHVAVPEAGAAATAEVAPASLLAERFVVPVPGSPRVDVYLGICTVDPVAGAGAPTAGGDPTLLVGAEEPLRTPYGRAVAREHRLAQGARLAERCADVAPGGSADPIAYEVVRYDTVSGAAVLLPRDVAGSSDCVECPGTLSGHLGRRVLGPEASWSFGTCRAFAVGPATRIGDCLPPLLSSPPGPGPVPMSGPLDTDPDDDGITSLTEVEKPLLGGYGTNPQLADSDDDGWPDGFEVGLTAIENGATTDLFGKIKCVSDGVVRTTTRASWKSASVADSIVRAALDPDVRDHDADGVPDGVEDIDYDGTRDLGVETSPNDLDSDNDQLADGRELRIFGGVGFCKVWSEGQLGGWSSANPFETNPLDGTTDADAIVDGRDVHPRVDVTFKVLPKDILNHCDSDPLDSPDAYELFLEVELRVGGTVITDRAPDSGTVSIPDGSRRSITNLAFVAAEIVDDIQHWEATVNPITGQTDPGTVAVKLEAFDADSSPLRGGSDQLDLWPIAGGGKAWRHNHKIVSGVPGQTEPEVPAQATGVGDGNSCDGNDNDWDVTMNLAMWDNVPEYYYSQARAALQAGGAVIPNPPGVGWGEN
ncbi:MAG: hypothetical protein ACT4PT_01690 [Methanobacteriota archaeon]